MSESNASGWRPAAGLVLSAALFGAYAHGGAAYLLGFVALVPDLYHGKVTRDATEAGALMKGLDWPHAMQDIAGAVRFLVSDLASYITGEKINVHGGGQAWR